MLTIVDLHKKKIKNAHSAADAFTNILIIIIRLTISKLNIVGVINNICESKYRNLAIFYLRISPASTVLLNLSYPNYSSWSGVWLAGVHYIILVHVEDCSTKTSNI